MALVLSTRGLEPGVFAQFQPSNTFAISQGGLRLAALVGTGITNATINGEVVTKGATDTQDTLAFSAVSLPDTITDENFVTYDIGTDYQLTSGKVDWSLANPAIQTGTVAGTSFTIDTQTLELFVNDVSETVTFSGSDPIAIASVISQINGAFSDVTASNDGSDHVVLTTTATVNTTLRIGTGTANDTLGFTAGIQTQSSQEPDAGVTYTLNYQRAKVTADYVPKTFFDLQSVIDEYGPIEMDDDGDVVNSIPLAASLAFQNGASAIMGMQIDPSVVPDLVAFQQAIDKLQAVDLNIVVALNPDPNLQNHIQEHIDQMSAVTEQKFRTALIGVPQTTTMSQAQTYATGLADRRLAIVWPPQSQVQLQNETDLTDLDSTYMAAAIAGLRTNPAFDVAEPLLRKAIFGFVSITDTLLRTQKNVLANAGVMIVESQSGTLRVRDGLTTDLTTADSAEYSVTEIIDFTADLAKNFLNAAFIGTKLLNETPGLMKASLNIILQSLIDNKILNDFTDVTVVVNNIDPRQLDVSFRIAPIFPVKWILIQFTI